MNLGIIKTLCNQKGIKIKNLCNEIGISDAGLYKAINNNKISSEYLEKLATYFGVPIGVFFGENDSTPELLNNIVKNLISTEQEQNELTQLYSYIENMMSSITIDDKEDIFTLIVKKFNKLENYHIIIFLAKLSEKDIIELVQHLKTEDIKIIVKLVIYRIVYKRSGIEHFAEFWFKYHNEPNRLKAL